MPKRSKAKLEENSPLEAESEQIEDPPEETMRTRSGRRIRPPSESKSLSKRTRISVLKELPVEKQPNSVEEEKKSPEVEPREEEVLSKTGSDTQEIITRPEAEPLPERSENIPKKKPAPNKHTPLIPLGKPKSGRVWKNRNKQRFSSVLRDKPLCTSWEKKMEAKREKQLVKQFSKSLKDAKAQKKEEQRKRKEESQRLRAENERKAEVVQVIVNTTKIKRMKKKLLRKIEKRDTLAAVQKSQKQNVKTKMQKNIKQNLT